MNAISVVQQLLEVNVLNTRDIDRHIGRLAGNVYDPKAARWMQRVLRNFIINMDVWAEAPYKAEPEPWGPHASEHPYGYRQAGYATSPVQGDVEAFAITDPDQPNRFWSARKRKWVDLNVADKYDTRAEAEQAKLPKGGQITSVWYSPTARHVWTEKTPNPKGLPVTAPTALGLHEPEPNEPTTAYAYVLKHPKKELYYLAAANRAEAGQWVDKAQATKYHELPDPAHEHVPEHVPVSIRYEPATVQPPEERLQTKRGTKVYKPEPRTQWQRVESIKQLIRHVLEAGKTYTTGLHTRTEEPRDPEHPETPPTSVWKEREGGGQELDPSFRWVPSGPHVDIEREFAPYTTKTAPKTARYGEPPTAEEAPEWVSKAEKSGKLFYWDPIQPTRRRLWRDIDRIVMWLNYLAYKADPKNVEQEEVWAFEDPEHPGLFWSEGKGRFTPLNIADRYEDEAAIKAVKNPPPKGKAKAVVYSNESEMKEAETILREMETANPRDVDAFRKMMTRAQNFLDILHRDPTRLLPDGKVIARHNNLALHKCVTAEVAHEMGKGAGWCTEWGTVETTRGYTERGPLYIVRKGGANYAQVHLPPEGSQQAKRLHNQLFNPQECREMAPLFVNPTEFPRQLWRDREVMPLYEAVAALRGGR